MPKLPTIAELNTFILILRAESHIMDALILRSRNMIRNRQLTLIRLPIFQSAN